MECKKTIKSLCLKSAETWIWYTLSKNITHFPTKRTKRNEKKNEWRKTISSFQKNIQDWLTFPWFFVRFLGIRIYHFLKHKFLAKSGITFSGDIFLWLFSIFPIFPGETQSNSNISHRFFHRRWTFNKFKFLLKIYNKNHFKTRPIDVQVGNVCCCYSNKHHAISINHRIIRSLTVPTRMQLTHSPTAMAQVR